MDDTSSDATETAAAVDMAVSPHFAAWLAGQGVGLAFTTGATSKLFLVGVTPEGTLSLTERSIEGAGGVAARGRSLYVAAHWQVWRFENALGPGEAADGFDAVYVPKASHVTGDVDCRDMAVTGDGRLVFVATRFNCLAGLSRDYSFRPFWRPGFVSELVPEDRCHLNGVALADGVPAFVTAAAASDRAHGWADEADGAGVVIDVGTGETVCGGLSLPAAPRLHGRTLWVLNTGTGFLGRVDAANRRFEPVAFCPGYARTMAVVGNTAVVGVARTGDGIPTPALDAALAERGTEARCGLLVIDLSSGNVMHWLRIDGAIDTVAGVAALWGYRRPRAVGFKSDEIARTISLPPDAAESAAGAE